MHSWPRRSRSPPPRSRGLEVVGLVDGTSLVEFRSENTRVRDSNKITGLDGDTSLVGIDHRVQDGELYGVGNSGGIYRIDADEAEATKIATLTIPLNGTHFGVDLNPAANALRVISDTGQNLRQPFATSPLVATVADTPLTNPATPPAQAPGALGVTGAAYTNNDLDTTTGTTLFDIIRQTGGAAGLTEPVGQRAAEDRA